MVFIDSSIKLKSDEYLSITCLDQVKYVVEFARALAATKGVYRVDLLTRQISSPEVDWSYGEPVEMLTTRSDDADSSGDSSGAYIIRLPCGPRERCIKLHIMFPVLRQIKF